MVELLIKYGVKVFVVGDEKQSIYGFRGSDKNAFNHLIDYIKSHKGTMFVLDTNYRSNKFIIDRVNNLFSRTFKYKHHKLAFNNQKMISNNDLGTKDDIKITFNENLAEIVKILSSKVENGKIVSYNDIVVLCRTNNDVLQAYHTLKESNIPTQLYLSKSIYKSKVIIDFCKLLNYISGGGKLEKEELFYTDLFVAANTYDMPDQEFYEKVDNAIHTFKENGILAVLNQVIEDCKLLQYYVEIEDKQSIANIQRFTEIIRDLVNDNMTSMEILNYLNIMIATGQDEGQPQTSQQNSVTISTIHTFKGLDSRYIIVNEVDNNLNKLHFADFNYSMSEGLSFNKMNIVPSLNVDNDILFETSKKQIIIDNLEEELRIMYVMMTRAKEKIILNSRKPLDKVKYQIAQNKEYVSYLRWLYNI